MDDDAEVCSFVLPAGVTFPETAKEGLIPAIPTGADFPAPTAIGAVFSAGCKAMVFPGIIVADDGFPATKDDDLPAAFAPEAIFPDLPPRADVIFPVTFSGAGFLPAQN